MKIAISELRELRGVGGFPNATCFCASGVGGLDIPRFKFPRATVVETPEVGVFYAMRFF